MPRIPSDDRQHFLQNFSVLNLYLPTMPRILQHIYAYTFSFYITIYAYVFIFFPASMMTYSRHCRQVRPNMLTLLMIVLPMIAIYSRHVLGIVGNVLALLYSLAHMRFCLAHDAPVWYSLVRA
jgi:hypothetical protein